MVKAKSPPPPQTEQFKKAVENSRKLKAKPNTEELLQVSVLQAKDLSPLTSCVPHLLLELLKTSEQR